MGLEGRSGAAAANAAAVTDVPLVLIANHEPPVAARLRSTLAGIGCRIETVCTGQEAVRRARRDPAPDLVLLDMALPGLDGLETLKRLRQSPHRTKVIMLFSPGEGEAMVQAARLGADDCIEKGCRSLALTALVRERLGASAHDGSTAREDLGNGWFFVAASPAMRKLHALVLEVAPTGVPVLCIGESGTGKEIVARLLHKRSRRGGNTFLKVNCAALPHELLESELFGYERGAFTGAVGSKPGKFELCDKGTILLDEIGEVPPQLQAKLLHVLQDGEFTRLGGRSRVKVDVRVVAATNADIRAALEAKRFREDLFYRLNTVVFEIPPLRERRQDIPILLGHFAERHGGRNGMPARPLSKSVLDFAQSYNWPGNVRELENFLKRYLVLGDRAMSGNGRDGLFLPDVGARTTSDNQETSAGTGLRALKSLTRGAKRKAESTAICRALEQTNWNRKEAARLLEISYKTLLDKLRLYGLDGKGNGQHECQ